MAFLLLLGTSFTREKTDMMETLTDSLTGGSVGRHQSSVHNPSQ